MTSCAAAADNHDGVGALRLLKPVLERRRAVHRAAHDLGDATAGVDVVRDERCDCVVDPIDEHVGGDDDEARCTYGDARYPRRPQHRDIDSAQALACAAQDSSGRRVGAGGEHAVVGRRRRCRFGGTVAHVTASGGSTVSVSAGSGAPTSTKAGGGISGTGA